jgi:hypothetical protein
MDHCDASVPTSFFAVSSNSMMSQLSAHSSWGTFSTGLPPRLTAAFPASLTALKYEQFNSPYLHPFVVQLGRAENMPNHPSRPLRICHHVHCRLGEHDGCCLPDDGAGSGGFSPLPKTIRQRPQRGRREGLSRSPVRKRVYRHIYTVFDGLTDRAAILRWRLLHMDGEPLQENQKNVVLHYGESICQLAIDFQAQIVSHRAPNLLLRVELIDEMEILSEQTGFFTAPKRLNLRLGANARTDL